MPEESVAAFETFVVLASKLACNFDVTCRAAGDCLAHAATILLDFIQAQQQPLDPEGEETLNFPLQGGDGPLMILLNE